MKRYSFKIGLLIVSSFLLSCKQQEKLTDVVVDKANLLPYYQDASFTPSWFEASDSALNTFHKIPDFELVNQNGDTITSKTFDNKIYVADFFFTSCPGICPKMTKNMTLVQDAFKKDPEVLLLSHSVTPEQDSISVLKTYAEKYHVDSNTWHLVTGLRSDIYSLGRAFYFVEEDLGVNKTDDDFLHTENFLLIDKNKHIRGIYNGLNKTSVQQLIADIKTLKSI